MRSITSIFLVALGLLHLPLTALAEATSSPIKSIQAVRTENAPVLDGRLDEALAGYRLPAGSLFWL